MIFILVAGELQDVLQPKVEVDEEVSALGRVISFFNTRYLVFNNIVGVHIRLATMLINQKRHMINPYRQLITRLSFPKQELQLDYRKASLLSIILSKVIGSREIHMF